MNPVAFISSFFAEVGFTDYHDSPLWRLRQSIHNLKNDDAFGAFLKENPNCEIAWAAEASEPPLADKTPLEVVDRLVEVLTQSDLYICILADARRGEKEHGSPIPISNLMSATSYFEIELHAAVIQQKEPHPFYSRRLFAGTTAGISFASSVLCVPRLETSEA
jgi:hypothetical protein